MQNSTNRLQKIFENVFLFLRVTTTLRRPRSGRRLPLFATNNIQVKLQNDLFRPLPFQLYNYTSVGL